MKAPFIGNDNIIHFEDYEPDKNKDLDDKTRKKGLYLPLACFVTSYARRKTIKTAQSIMDYSIKKYGRNAFVYS